MVKKRFPRDCSIECPYYRTYDMSVDDWTSICTKLNAQIDDCDMDFIWDYCPLDGQKEETENAIDTRS